MRRCNRILATLALLCVFLSGCTSGGSSSTPPLPQDPTSGPTTLGWSPPQSFTDGSPLVPERDLKYFEVYIKRDPQYTPGDLPITTVSPGINTFYLADLSSPLPRGVTYYFFVRAVPVEGEASDFSAVGTFFLPE